MCMGQFQNLHVREEAKILRGWKLVTENKNRINAELKARVYIYTIC